MTELVRLPEGETVRVAGGQRRRCGRRSRRCARKRVEFFKLTIGDGVQVDGWRILPPDFDPAKKYPLLVYVYGEPAGQTVQDSWGGSGYLWHLMLAQQGYIVASFDNRGTPAPRGRAWRKSIYRQIGILASADQAAAVRAALAAWPYVDAERVGVWGWSGGGSMTLNAMFRYPDLYKTGISVASVPDQRLYDTIYQERYMGLPAGQCRGLQERLAHHLRQGPEGQPAHRPRHGRRQRPLPGLRAARQRARGRQQGLRDDGLSEPVPRHLRGAGHDAPPLHDVHPLSQRESAAGRADALGEPEARSVSDAQKDLLLIQEIEDQPLDGDDPRLDDEDPGRP